MALTKRWGTAVALFRDAGKAWSSDKASSLAASLAYYTLFSIAPLIIVAVAVAGFIFGARAAQGQMFGELQGLMGASSAKLIETMVASASKPHANLIASLIGIVGLLLGASGVFVQLQAALDTVWKVPATAGAGAKGFVLGRLRSFSLVLIMGLLLLASLALSTGLTVVETHLPVHIAVLWNGVSLFLSLAVVTVLFAMIYKILPTAHVEWRDVWLGAAVTGLLFTAGKAGLAFYLARGSVASSYGAAGSLAVVLIWIYYSAQIFLFGAEFTRVYAQSHGSRSVQGSPRRSPALEGSRKEIPASTWLPS